MEAMERLLAREPFSRGSRKRFQSLARFVNRAWKTGGGSRRSQTKNVIVLLIFMSGKCNTVDTGYKVREALTDNMMFLLPALLSETLGKS